MTRGPADVHTHLSQTRVRLYGNAVAVTRLHDVSLLQHRVQLKLVHLRLERSPISHARGTDLVEVVGEVV